MPNFVTPGPVSAATRRVIDTGTRCITASPVPGYKGRGTRLVHNAAKTLQPALGPRERHADNVRALQHANVRTFLKNLNEYAIDAATAPAPEAKPVESPPPRTRQAPVRRTTDQATLPSDLRLLDALRELQLLDSVRSGDFHLAWSALLSRWDELFPLNPLIAQPRENASPRHSPNQIQSTKRSRSGKQQR